MTSHKVERDWSSLVEQILADPKLTEAEVAFLETGPDLFKTTRDEFLMATEIVEKSHIAAVGFSR